MQSSVDFSQRTDEEFCVMDHSSTPIDFGDGKILRHHILLSINPGNSDSLVARYEYDLVYAISGKGVVVTDQGRFVISSGEKAIVERGKTYVIEASPIENLTVAVYGVDTEGE